MSADLVRHKCGWIREDRAVLSIECAPLSRGLLSSSLAPAWIFRGSHGPVPALKPVLITKRSAAWPGLQSCHVFLLHGLHDCACSGGLEEWLGLWDGRFKVTKRVVELNVRG